MSRVSTADVRKVVLAHLREPLLARGVVESEVPDDFDLLLEGVIDSLGLVEIVNVIEEHFAVHVDFEELDPEQITVLGPLCRYIEAYSCWNGNSVGKLLRFKG